ncbi:MAG TPA: hypothetical protein ENH99_01615 [Candidatus Pacearchaeota archaeon]|uniref:TFIIB-type domain-containing protein n=1 Tax=marine sediment metagenome TaxID=412755 RepID=A0A0F9F6N5_9ZZZZ|nr:hypothetical protein [Candidatus Pacearchaeota archaeon]
MNDLESSERAYRKLKEYMYKDICPKCGASPTFQKDVERFVYCKSCGFTLDTSECKIIEKG